MDKVKVVMKEMITDKLNYMLSKGEFHNRYIVLFGVNPTSEMIYEYLIIKKIPIKSIIDNCNDKIGRLVFGIKVCSPEDSLKNYRDNALILIASQYYNEMSHQLEQIGYEKGKHIIKLLDFSKIDNIISKDYLSQKTFDRDLDVIKKGYEIYQSLLNKYGYDVHIFTNPYNATGDIYMVGQFFSQYVQKNNINNYVVIVKGNASKKVAELFNIKNIEVICESETDALIKFADFIGNENINYTILHYSFHEGPGVVINNLQGISENLKVNWLDMFRYCVFTGDYYREKPALNNNTQYLEELFSNNGLNKGKTVILAPYAQSFPCLPNEIWEKLVELLIRKGFSVCTNSIGDKEPPIQGTKPIFFTLDNAINVIEYAGYFVGLRSGLCDVISSANAKKVILYQESVIFASASNFFSFNAMEYGDNITEIIYKNGDINKIINTIVEGLRL